MSRVERLRWRIAALIDRLPGQCWAGVASWALGEHWWPLARISDVCRRDAARCGVCYCGRLRTGGGEGR